MDLRHRSNAIDKRAIRHFLSPRRRARRRRTQRSRRSGGAARVRVRAEPYGPTCAVVLVERCEQLVDRQLVAALVVIACTLQSTCTRAVARPVLRLKQVRDAALPDCGLTRTIASYVPRWPAGSIGRYGIGPLTPNAAARILLDRVWCDRERCGPVSTTDAAGAPAAHYSSRRSAASSITRGRAAIAFASVVERSVTESTLWCARVAEERPLDAGRRRPSGDSAVATACAVVGGET